MSISSGKPTRNGYHDEKSQSKVLKAHNEEMSEQLKNTPRVVACTWEISQSFYI